MYTEIVWQERLPCELPDEFNPFSIRVKGGSDYNSLGKLKKPKSYKNNESESAIEWIACELLMFILLEQNQDLSESRIRNYISSGNWIIRHLAEHNLDPIEIESYEIITKIFQKIASKTKSNTINRSSDSKNGNRTDIYYIQHLKLFLFYLYPDDVQIISDHLDHGKKIEPIIEPPSEFSVVESTRYMAKHVLLEEPKISGALSIIEDSLSPTKSEITSFFKSSKNYRNCFIYLVIALTGINGTNVMLITLEDLDISNDKKTSGKSITVYKKRANKAVSFEIPKEILIKFIIPFVNLFTKYNTLCDRFNPNLKLNFIGQQTLCEDKDFRHIDQYYTFRSWTKSIRKKVIDHIDKRLKEENIHEHIIKFPTPSDLRNYKSTAIETKHGHNLAAIIMQHSPEVSFKHYLRRQEKEAIENMGEFYADFENIINNISDKVKERLTPVPAGQCSATDDQKSIIELNTEKSAYVIGDCTTPTGCLFCSFFVAHAEEDGIYKLISMREYILLKNQVVSYHSEIENSYGSILDRINDILDHLKSELKETANKWIENAENKVAYGLHPIWQELYEMDMALLGDTI